MICRGYKHLQARLILEKQDEMRLIEEELRDMDLMDQEATPKRNRDGKEVMASGPLYTRHRRNAVEAAARKEFFSRAERVYKDYAELVTAANQLTTLEKPAHYEWKNVSRFITDAKPVVEREAGWIGWRKDLVTIRGAREHAYFDAIMETIINHVKSSRWLKRLLNPPATMQKWLAANASAEKAASITNMVFLSILVPLLFVVPIYVLTMVQHHIGPSIAVLIAFTIAFTFVLVGGTPAKAHEIWSCAAA